MHSGPPVQRLSEESPLNLALSSHCRGDVPPPRRFPQRRTLPEFAVSPSEHEIPLRLHLHAILSWKEWLKPNRWDTAPSDWTDGPTTQCGALIEPYKTSLLVAPDLAAVAP